MCNMSRGGSAPTQTKHNSTLHMCKPELPWVNRRMLCNTQMLPDCLKPTISETIIQTYGVHVQGKFATGHAGILKAVSCKLLTKTQPQGQQDSARHGMLMCTNPTSITRTRVATQACSMPIASSLAYAQHCSPGQQAPTFGQRLQILTKQSFPPHVPSTVSTLGWQGWV